MTKTGQLWSIKWYKNYVEFYRFLPPPLWSSSSANEQQARAAQEEPGPKEEKHEFELEGINLDVSLPPISLLWATFFLPPLAHLAHLVKERPLAALLSRRESPPSLPLGPLGLGGGRPPVTRVCGP